MAPPVRVVLLSNRQAQVSFLEAILAMPGPPGPGAAGSWPATPRPQARLVVVDLGLDASPRALGIRPRKGPVIVVACQAASPEAVEALVEAGADDVLTLGDLTPDRLRAAVRKALARRRRGFLRGTLARRLPVRPWRNGVRLAGRWPEGLAPPRAPRDLAPGAPAF